MEDILTQFVPPLIERDILIITQLRMSYVTNAYRMVDVGGHSPIITKFRREIII